MAGSTADIGIRVFLDDAASQALFAIDGQLGQMGMLARRAGIGMGMLSSSMVALAAVAGLAVAFGLFAFALKFSIDQAFALQTAMFGIAVAFHVPMTAAMAFTNVLMNLAAGSIFTTADIATGMGILGRAGYSLQAVMGSTADGMHGMAAAGVALSIAIRTDVVSGFNLLSQVMSAYHMNASQAMATADLLQFGFEHQTSSVAQFSAALAQVTPFAYQFHVPLADIISALDTMGPAMKSTSTAGTALRYTLAGLYSPTAGARAEMVTLGLASVDAAGKFHSAFFDAKGNAIDFGTALLILQGKLKGLTMEEQIAALHQIFSIRGGQGADVMLASLDKYILGLKKLDASNLNSGGAMQRWQQVMQTGAGALQGLKSSIQDLGAVIGGALAGPLTTALTHMNAFVSSVRASVIANPAAAAKFLLLGLGISGVGLAIFLLMTPIGQFVGIMLLVVAAVIGLAAVLPRVISGFQQFMASANPIAGFLREVAAGFAFTGKLIMGMAQQALPVIMAALRVLGATISSMAAAIMPAFAAAWVQIKVAFAPLIPYIPQIRMLFMGLAMILGGIVLTAILLVIAVIAGVARGLAFFLAGAATVVAGVIQLFLGLQNFFHAFVVIINGIFSLNLPMIVSGFRQMGTAITLIVTGMGNIIKGIFIAVIGGVVGLVSGFIQTIISFFQHLSSTLVGHSIIPDMMNAMRSVIMSGLSAVIGAIGSFVSSAISRFMGFVSSVGGAMNAFRSMIISAADSAMSSLVSAISSGVSRALGFVQSLPGRIAGALGGLAGMLFSSGANAMAMFANGLSSMLGAVVGQVAAAANAVAGFLGHLSPAKMGPLAHDDEWMPNMMKMFAGGIKQHAPLLAGAMSGAAAGMASVPGMSRMAVPSTLNGVGGVVGGNTTVPLIVDGQVLAQVVLNRVTGHMQMNGMGRSFR
jgi:TP901 family phage tail tape measure protein